EFEDQICGVREYHNSFRENMPSKSISYIHDDTLIKYESKGITFVERCQNFRRNVIIGLLKQDMGPNYNVWLAKKQIGTMGTMDLVDSLIQYHMNNKKNDHKLAQTPKSWSKIKDDAKMKIQLLTVPTSAPNIIATGPKAKSTGSQ